MGEPNGEGQEVVEKWFSQSATTIRSAADTDQQRAMAYQLYYTLQDFFV